MKKVIFFGMVCMMAITLCTVQGCCKDDEPTPNRNNGTPSGHNNTTDTVPVDTIEEPVFVDLGLESGTLWKSANEGDGAHYSYNEAMNAFGDALPTAEQLRELKDAGHWTWNGNGYTVAGPNGNTIELPAEGYRDYEGNINATGTYGSYWSSTPDDAVQNNAWCLTFTESFQAVSNNNTALGKSVRLVRRN